MKIKPIIIILIILFSGFGYYKLTGNATYQQATVNVTRVIDGDTIETDIGNIRLLGINTPEKKQPFYQEAADFLKEKIEGKQVKLELHGKDKYSRYLGYVFYNKELINKKIIQEGLATLYYYDEDSHISELKKAEQEARNKEKNLWKKSPNSGCIEIIKLEYKDGGNCKNQEQLVLKNKCNNMSVIIKDDANHIYNEKVQTGLFTKNYSCIWNDAGDSVYIRDASGLILFYRY